jgi:hypothetical protein
VIAIDGQVAVSMKYDARTALYLTGCRPTCFVIHGRDVDPAKPNVLFRADKIRLPGTIQGLYTFDKLRTVC